MANRDNNVEETNTKYSIIIPHYDIPHLLERLLNTIPEQKDIQVIVVDDCSPGSDTYLEKYMFLKRNNVEFYVTDKNGGGGHARNVGLKYAKGKWILFADADDIFINGFDCIIDKYYLSEEDIIYFQIDSIDSSTLSKKSKRCIEKNREIEMYMQTKEDKGLRYCQSEPWGKMIKKKIITQHKIQFDECEVANDYFFSVQAGFYAKKVKGVTDTIYTVITRRNSVGNEGWRNSFPKLCIRLAVAIKVQLFLQERGITLKPMPIRSLMVLLLQQRFTYFIKTLYKLHSQHISIITLFKEMIIYRQKRF